VYNLRKYFLVLCFTGIFNLAYSEDYSGQLIQDIDEIKELTKAHEANDFVSNLYLQLFIKNYSNEKIAYGAFHNDLLNLVTKVMNINSNSPDEISCASDFIWLFGMSEYPAEFRLGNMDWSSKLEVALAWSENQQSKIILELRRVEGMWKILNIYYEKGNLQGILKSCLNYYD
jgi:hypothetical protein